MHKKIICLLPFLLTACAEKNDEYKRQAQESYDEIKGANNSSSLFRLAESMRKHGNFDIASRSYKQALEIDPTNVGAYIGLSQCLRMTGKPAAAVNTLNRVPSELRDTYWYKELGSVYTTSQKPKQCVEAYSKAYAEAPSDPGTLNGLAVCNDLMGKHMEAQEWYKQAIAASPQDTNLRSNYGLSVALSGRPNEAIEILSEVNATESATSRDRQNLAIAYGLSGDMQMAAQLFSQDLPQNEVRRNIAFVHKLALTQPKSRTMHEQEKNAFTPSTPSDSSSEPSNASDNSFITELASNNDGAPLQTPQNPNGTPQALEPISKDTHVTVNPLPTVENYHQEPVPVTAAKEKITSEEAHGYKVISKPMKTKKAGKKVESTKPDTDKKPAKKSAKKSETKKTTAKKIDKKES